jgi:hypothetical protein
VVQKSKFILINKKLDNLYAKQTKNKNKQIIKAIEDLFTCKISKLDEKINNQDNSIF